MCELQIIQKLGKEKINKADMGEFFKMMCFGSMSNHDAFGVFNSDAFFKDAGAFDASKLDEYTLTNCNFIVGHNRFSTGWCKVKNPNKVNIKIKCLMPSICKSMGTSTSHSSAWNPSSGWMDNLFNIYCPTIRCGASGLDNEEATIITEKNVKHKKILEEKSSEKIVNYMGRDSNRNNHPFMLKDFVLVHNGTISNAQAIHIKYNFNTTISTDSYVILELISYFFEKSNIKNRIKRIAYAIQSTCEKLSGRYSVILYDKKSKNTFYFKSAFTSFSLCKYGDNILCGSTSMKNLDYLYFGMDKEYIHIKDNRIYMITSDIKYPVIDITPIKYRRSFPINLCDILKETNRDIKMNKVEEFLEVSFGFVPLYGFTFGGDLKISGNDSYGIRDKIEDIVESPKKRLGWYIIKGSDIKSVNKKKERQTL